MKRLFIIPFALCVAVYACKKAPGPADGNSVQQNNNLDSTVAMTAMVNGSSWKSDSVFAYYINYSGNDSGVIGLQLTGTQKVHDTATTFTFYITTYTGPDTYYINPPINTATFYSNGNVRNFADTGWIVVASDTAYALKGTFYFATGTYTVSNGVFNAALP
jgi:hypothetical protein